MKKGRVILVAGVLALAIPANATIINVPGDQPTIQAGIDASVDGDTVIVGLGRYTENIDFSGKNILVQSESGPESTIIAIATTGLPTVQFASSENQSATIQGFTILGDSSSWGIYIHNSSPTIYGNKIIGHDAGIFSTYGSPLIRRNEISYCYRTIEPDLGGGIVLDNSLYSIIDSNTIHHNFAPGGNDGAIFIIVSENVSIVRNIFYLNSAGGYCPGMHLSFSSNIIIENNTFAKHEAPGASGVLTLYLCSDIDIRNNIFSYSNTHGIYLFPGNSDISSDYNCFFSNDAGPTSGIAPGSNSIFDDPQFTDFENNDFHLLDISPCIDAGDPNSPYDPDLTIADMGALYFWQYRVLNFHLIEPANDSVLIEPIAAFVWHSTEDNGPGFPIEYIHYLDDNPTFDSPIISENLGDTVYTYSEELPRSAEYYWRVQATNNDSPPTFSDETWSFYIDGYPAMPEILGPENGAEVDAETYLSWLLGDDPDPMDTVSYSLQVDDDVAFGSPEIDESGISPSGAILDEAMAIMLGDLPGFEDLEESVAYYWRVRSDDLYGGSSDWTDGTNYFIYLYSGQNPGPEPFPLFEPPDSARHVVYYTNFIWGNTSDPYYYFDFTLQYSIDDSFSDVVISISGLEDTSFAIPTDNLAQTGEELFWRVLAINQEGQVRIGGIPDPEVRFLQILFPGDVDGDGVVHIADIIYLVAYYRDQVPPPDPLLLGDLDGDCVVGIADIINLISVVRGTLPPPPRPDCEEPLAIIKRIPSQQQKK